MVYSNLLEAAEANHPRREQNISDMSSRSQDSGPAYKIKDDSNHEAAAGTDSNVLLVEKIHQRNLEAISARARIGVGLLGIIPGHVLDLDVIVDGELFVVGHGMKFLARGVRRGQGDENDVLIYS